MSTSSSSDLPICAAVVPGGGGSELQHVVLFSFPEPLSDAEAGMRAQVECWPTEIGTMRAIRS